MSNPVQTLDVYSADVCVYIVQKLKYAEQMLLSHTMLLIDQLERDIYYRCFFLIQSLPGSSASKVFCYFFIYIQPPFKLYFADTFLDGLCFHNLYCRPWTGYKYTLLLKNLRLVRFCYCFFKNILRINAAFIQNLVKVVPL